jgi:glycosyltransferase involved in cell wall biosynthesis
LAKSKPVVLFDEGNGCGKHVPTHGCRIVRYGDCAAAARAVVELAGDPKLRKTLGKRNKDFADRHLKFEEYARKLIMGLAVVTENNVDGKSRVRVLTGQQKSLQRTRGRIVFCSPSWGVSGVNSFVNELGKTLRHRGFDVSVLFTTCDAACLDRSMMPEIPYHFLTNCEVSLHERRSRILEYLSLHAPCIFVPNFDYVASSIAPRLPANVRTVGILHCDDDEHYVHGYRMGHFWDRIICVSETIQNKFLKTNPAFAERTTTIRCGIDAAEIVGVNHGTNDLRTAKELRIVYTGRIIQEQKRIFDFESLVGGLVRRGIDCQFTFIGDGPDLRMFSQLMKPFVDRGCVRMLGRLNPQQLRVELANQHVFCLLSAYEGLPISMLEAMAAGCIPVVTDIQSGIREILRHEQNSMISPVGDIAAMSENLALLADDLRLRRLLASRARQTISQFGLTTARMTDCYQKVFQDLCSASNATDTVPELQPLNCPQVDYLLSAA